MGQLRRGAPNRSWVAGAVATACRRGKGNPRFPFTLLDPSRQYQTPGGVRRPDVGLVNGMDGPDLVLETNLTVSLVPEPATLALVAAGAAGLVAAARRRGGTVRYA